MRLKPTLLKFQVGRDKPHIAPGEDRDKKEAEKCDGKPKNTTKLNVTETIFPTENKSKSQCNPFL